MLTRYAQTLKRLPKPIYKLGAQFYADGEFPRHIFIETTAACNLKCNYCPRERRNDSMDYEMFKRIIDESSDYGPRSFSLHLFGEPLLYPFWQEAVSYIKKKNPKNTVLFTSNGTLIERFINDLIDSKIDKFLWTWRPEARWSESTNNKLMEWKAFTVRIIDEVTPEKEKEKFIKWPRVETRKLHNYGGEVQLEKFGAKSTDGKRWPCYHLWFAPAVSWNGKILICCSDPHQKEEIGELETQTVAEAWQGQKLSLIRKSHLKGEYSGICEKCDVWKQYPDIFFEFQK